jgi:hypothetical protein
VATLYLDTDVSLKLVPWLFQDAHVVYHARARRLPLDRPDSDQLLTAVDHDAVLVTHNRHDFVLVHRTWRLLAGRWNVSEVHRGILVPYPGKLDVLYEQMAEFFSLGHDLLGACWVNQQSKGWFRSD